MLHMYSLSNSGVTIKFILALRADVFEIQTDFQNFIFGHGIWN